MVEVQLPDLSIFKQYAKDQLSYQLQSAEGDKDLFLDEELMKPLDQISGGVSYLKQHGVQKIYKLQRGNIIDVGPNKRMFITRPYPSRMALIAEFINIDKSKKVEREYYVVVAPRQLTCCDLILEQEGVFGDVTISEYPLDIVPLDIDMMSLEMPSCYRQFFMENDTTWLHTLARAVHVIQGTFGSIAKGFCVGEKSALLFKLIQMMSSDENPAQNTTSEIGSFLFIDQDIDKASILCSQHVYEGLVDETFGIKAGIVDFTKDVSGTEQPVAMNLSSSDQIFAEIRGMHITNVFPYLSYKAKQLQCGFEKRNQLDTVRDFKQFVAEDLGKLKKQHKALAMHIGACEKIMLKKQAEYFEDCLHVEQCLLADSETKDCVSYVETCINKQTEELDCLRLLCLLSVCRGGLDNKTYLSLKLQYLQSFGYKHLVTMKCLKDVGLFTDNRDKRNTFPKTRRKFNLIPKDPDVIMKCSPPKDVAYVYGGGYTPFIAKVVEQLLSKGLLPGFEETLQSLHIPTCEHKLPVSARSSGSTTKVSSSSQKVVLVVLLGGCTHTELNALRFIAKQLSYKFVFLTTSILTSRGLLKLFTVDSKT